MVGDSWVARRHGIQYCDRDTRGDDCSCYRCRPPRGSVQSTYHMAVDAQDAANGGHEWTLAVERQFLRPFAGMAAAQVTTWEEAGRERRHYQVEFDATAWTGETRMQNPLKKISDAWYRLGAWWEVQQWRFADWLAGQVSAGSIQECTRERHHDGPCNGFPSPTCRVYSPEHEMALDQAELDQLRGKRVKSDEQMLDDAISKAEELKAEQRRERRNKLARDRYAAAKKEAATAKRKPKAGKKKATRGRKTR